MNDSVLLSMQVVSFDGDTLVRGKDDRVVITLLAEEFGEQTQL